MGVIAQLMGRSPAAVAPAALAEPAQVRVRADNLVLTYPTLRAVDRVSLQLAAGELAFIIGPTGAGKTSLLRLLAGLRRPTSGEVWVEGLALHRVRAGSAR